MPVAPTMATRGGRGEADDIVIHRFFVARSIELEELLEETTFFAQRIDLGLIG